MLITPSLFLSAVSGIIRLGRLTRVRYLESLQSDPLVLVLSAPSSAYPMQEEKVLRTRALNWLFENPDNPAAWLQPSGRFGQLFTAESIQRGHTPEMAADSIDQRSQIDDLMNFFFDAVRSDISPELKNRLIRNANHDPRIKLIQKDWLDSHTPTRGWARFGLELADIAIEIVGAQPEILGLDRKAETVLNSLLPRFHELIDTAQLDRGEGESFGEQLIKTFVHGALATVSEHPDLVTTEARWEPVISGVLSPMKQEMEGRDGTLQFIAHDRLSTLVRGPVLHGALKAIDANSDAFLKGEASEGKIMGAVTRTVLSDMVTLDSERFDIASAFGPEGLLVVYNGAMKAASTRPELFFGASADENSPARRIFVEISKTLQASQTPPFSLDSGLGPAIIGVLFDVASEYADVAIRAGASNGDDWDVALAEVYATLSTTLLQGLEDGINTQGNQSRAIFNSFFSRQQALEVIRILANHIASTPRMVTGEGANPEVKNIARSVATLLAQDEQGLLKSDDWRKILSVMMRSASRNPGVLFSLDDGAVSDQLAVKLVSHVLRRASASMQGPSETGKVMFGETLREALVATLQAANLNLARAVADLGQAADDPSHLSELEAFIDRLNHYASQSEDPELALSADDWVHLFKFYIAHILEKGPGAVEEIGDEQIKAALKGDVFA